MGNNPTKHHNKDRPRKNVHWKSAESPSPPGKPILVPGTAETTPDVVSIRWDRPKTDGGSPLIGFLVEHRRTGSPHWVRATPTLVQYPELTLTGLEPGWRYQFRVAAQNVVGLSNPSELSDPLTVSLQRNAITAPRFTTELTDTTAIENEKIEFTVTIVGTPAPDVNWFKDGFEIFSSRRTKILTENNKSVLTIHQAALTDEGEIKCSATNRAGHAVTRSRLLLQAPPKIRLPRQYEDGLLIEAEEVIRLKVGVAGRPPPAVLWMQNGEIITHGDRYEIITNDKNSSLKINSCRRSDRGEYNVKAINKLGEDNASFLVTVTAKPSPPSKVSISMSIGKSVTLMWNVPEDDGGCKIGNYVVEYNRLGWNVWLKAATTRQLNATLNDLIEGSEYKFRVKAENPYGLSDPSDESDVLFIPDPKRGITKPSSGESDSAIDENKPEITPRKRQASSVTSSNHSIESASSAKASSTDKIELANTTRVKANRPVVNVKLIPQIFDSETIARDMSYGTPDYLKPKENKRFVDKFDNQRKNVFREKSPTTVTSERSPQKITQNESIGRDRSPAPIKEIFPPPTGNPSLLKKENSPVKINISSSPTISKESSPINQPATTSEKARRKSATLETPRENNDVIHSSGEFMLVLYDDKEPKNVPKQQSFDFEIDDVMPPPPLSLSAPELGVEPPPPPVMRRAVSSTELLYERALARFYNAVALEESEKARKQSSETHGLKRVPPMMRKGSFGENDRSSAERRGSLRRRLSGENSLNLTGSLKAKENELSSEDQEGISSDERNNNENSSRRKYNENELNDVPDSASSIQEEYTDDYTDSTASSEESETEKFKRLVREHKPMFGPEEIELDTYHPNTPQIRITSPYSQPMPDQAVEVLSKPFALPSPDFVPKPILKRPLSVENDTKEVKEEDIKKETKKNKKIKSSPSKPERKSLAKIFDRKGSDSSMKNTEIDVTGNNNNEARVKSEVDVSRVVAGKISANELAKNKQLEQRHSSLEEEKVVIEYYSDIVRELGSGKKSSVPLYLSTEELKKAAASQEDVNDGSQTNRPEMNKNKVGKAEISRYAQKDTINPQMSTSRARSPISRATADRQGDSRSNSAARKPNDLLFKTDSTSKEFSNENTTRGRSENVKSRHGNDSMIKSRDQSGSRSNSLARRTTKTPTEIRTASKTRNRSESKSPAAMNRRKLPSDIVKTIKVPMRQEVRTIILASGSSTPLSVSPEPRTRTPEEEQFQEQTDTKVKSTMAYITDVTLFIVACWIYIFKDARLCLPILALMVYRQLGDAVKDNLPSWMKRKKS